MRVPGAHYHFHMHYVHTGYPIQYGVEIESHNAEINDVPLPRCVDPGYDASIEGPRPIEIRVGPLPYDKMVKKILWLYRNMSLPANHSCGIHIHVDSRAAKGISRVGTAIGAIQLSSMYFSMSDSDRIALFGRSGGRYYSSRDVHSHYSPVSISGNTLEFRMFAANIGTGGTNPAWTLHCLRMVAAMIKARKKTIMKVLRTYEKMFGLCPLDYSP